jgi:N-acetyl-gamma-glutamyl-phosphate reductase
MKVGVIGASGYAGGEMLRLLAGHPELEVVVAQGGDRSAGAAVEDVHPALAGAYGGLSVGGLDAEALDGVEVVFSCLPSGHAHTVVPTLLGGGRLVVDLSADFRLVDPTAYERWYGFTHSAPELLRQAVYGLPELDRSKLPGARLIAAPGCYVTAATLALAPLVAAGAIEPTGVIVDGASGVSGAGRSLTHETHFSTVNESFSAYGLLNHRHTPEIEQATGAEVLFTPHLAPMTRGILVTCYARATEGGPEPAEVLRDAYAGERFVQVVEAPPATGETVGSNNCRVAARHDTRTGYVVVLAALDNLVKGAAGQAIQAANAALGLPEHLGLPTTGLVP